MNRFRLMVTESIRSMAANLSTTIAATMTVLIGMFLLGLFIALGTWVISWSDHVKSQLDVKVDFCDAGYDSCKHDATPKEVNAVRVYLADQQIAGKVKTYRFVSKDEALRRMRKTNPALVDSLSSNPLPASYEVTPAHAEDVKAVAAGIRAQHFSGVDEVQDGKKTSKRILQVARVIEIVFLIAVIVLLASSVLLIANTIRLSIFSRRREIEVMKLVGATNWFIRGPFMLEGLICGLGGALLAVILLTLGKEIALPSILPHIGGGSDVHALPFALNALALLGTGLLLGAAGSAITLRRFLQV